MEDAENQKESYAQQQAEEAMKHLIYYSQTSEIDALRQALACWQTVIEYASYDSYLFLSGADHLANGLRELYSLTEAFPDMRYATLCYQQLLQHLPPTAKEWLYCSYDLGKWYWLCYEKGQDPADLEQACKAWEQGATQYPVEDEFWSQYIEEIFGTYRYIYDETENTEILTWKIQLQEQLVSRAASDASERADRLDNLAYSYRERYQALGALSDLEQAIQLRKQALQLEPETTPSYQRFLKNLSNNLNLHYEATQQAEDLDQLIETYQRFIELFSADFPDYFPTLNNLGYVYSERYEHKQELTDLESAIHWRRLLLEHVAFDNPQWTGYAGYLSSWLMEYGLRTKDSSCLREAIALLEKIVLVDMLSTSPDLDSLEILFKACQVLYSETKQQTDLEYTLTIWRQLLTHTTPRTERWSRMVHVVIRILQAHYTVTAQVGDLEEAIQLFNQELEQTTLDNATRAADSEILTSILLDHYEHTNALDDLQQALRLSHQAISLLPPDDPKLPEYLNTKSMIQGSLFKHTKNPAVVEQAIKNARQASALVPQGSAQWANYRHNVSTMFGELYELTGDITALEQSIEYGEQSVKQGPTNTLNHLLHLSNLAMTLLRNYNILGDASNLQQAIALLHEVVEKGSSDAVLYPGYLNNLGVSLRARYRLTGDINDLNEGIRLHKQAYTLSEQRPATYSISGSELAMALREQFVYTQNLVVLKQAIELLDKSTNHIPHTSSNYLETLSRLAGALREYHYFAKIPADITRSIQIYERVVHEASPDNINMPAYLNNLGNALSDRYNTTFQMPDLDRAIQLHKQAIDLCAPHDPMRVLYLHNLALCYTNRYAYNKDQSDFEQAIINFEETCKQGSRQAVALTLRAAKNWGVMELQRDGWAQASKAYAYALDASELLFKEQSLRANKEIWLSEAETVYPDAAYAFAKEGKLVEAVETIERGCARLLAQALEQDRSQLAQLREAYPALYEQYKKVTDQLATFERQELSGTTAALQDRSFVRASQQARTDLNAIVHDIQMLPGYDTFMKTITFEKISRAVDSTPLVYLTFSISGLALILSPVQEDSVQTNMPFSMVSNGIMITPCWLDGLTPSILNELMNGLPETAFPGYITAYQDWKSRPDKESSQYEVWLTTLDETTHRLWELVMAPLIEVLTHLNITQIQLVSLNLLGFLPLHAAWTSQAHEEDRLYALDRLQICYVPNAQAIIQSQAQSQQIEQNTQDYSLLAIDEPLPVSAERLPYSMCEVDAAVQHFSLNTLLQHEDARFSEVMRILSEPDPPLIWHFSCHGSVDFAEPLNNCLLLSQDKKLTLRDLFSLRLDNVRLVILSACETGIPSSTIVNEFISLPTGLIQAGVAGIISCLWPVDSLSTAALIVRFYDLWRDQGLLPSLALYQAQQWIRDTTNAQKLEYFQRFSPELGEHGLSDVAATMLNLAFTVRPPNERQHAHPYYWAAFTYFGT